MYEDQAQGLCKSKTSANTECCFSFWFWPRQDLTPQTNKMSTAVGNCFSVTEWHKQDQAMTVYLIDVSGSTKTAFKRGQTVLSFEKALISQSLTTLSKTARQLLIVIRDRCPKCGPVKVFCECPSPQCFQPVWLTPDEYERARETRSVRSPGH